MAVFDLAYEKVLHLEGGYKLSYDPVDAGGMTFAGISRVVWPDWPGWLLIDSGELSGHRIEAMVESFYKIHYWNEIKGDQIRFQGVAFMLYDFAVNAGIKTAVKLAQKIVGSEQDGVMGPKTISKLSRYVFDEASERLFMAEYSLAKVYRYKDICLNDRRRCMDRVGSNLKFLCGWINRVQKGQYGH